MASRLHMERRPTHDNTGVEIEFAHRAFETLFQGFRDNENNVYEQIQTDVMQHVLYFSVMKARRPGRIVKGGPDWGVFEVEASRHAVQQNMSADEKSMPSALSVRPVRVSALLKHGSAFRCLHMRLIGPYVASVWAACDQSLRGSAVYCRRPLCVLDGKEDRKRRGFEC